MIKDYSFGFVPIFRGQDGIEFLLVQLKAGYWSLPKGHPENNETDIEAAVRELEEETGISKIQIIPGFECSENYKFKRENKIYNKTNKYFLTEVQSKDVKIQPEEILDFTWVDFDHALEKATFKGAKKILTEAKKYLDEH